jgi:hypothetical protein
MITKFFWYENRSLGVWGRGKKQVIPKNLRLAQSDLRGSDLLVSLLLYQPCCTAELVWSHNHPFRVNGPTKQSSWRPRRLFLSAIVTHPVHFDQAFFNYLIQIVQTL